MQQGNDILWQKRKICVYLSESIHISIMRTNIIINDDLMNKALKASGSKTKRATVEKALKLLIRIKNQQKIKALKGKLTWEGDLDLMRSDI